MRVPYAPSRPRGVEAAAPREREVEAPSSPPGPDLERALADAAAAARSLAPHVRPFALGQLAASRLVAGLLAEALDGTARADFERGAAMLATFKPEARLRVAALVFTRDDVERDAPRRPVVAPSIALRPGRGPTTEHVVVIVDRLAAVAAEAGRLDPVGAARREPAGATR